MNAEQVENAPSGSDSVEAEPDQQDKLQKATEQLEKVTSLLSALGTGSEDAAGTVTLQDKAGTLGGWLAHRQVAAAADLIATDVLGHLKDGDRVLVVDSRDVLAADADVVGVRAWMTSTGQRLTDLVAEVDALRASFIAGFAGPDHVDSRTDPRIGKRGDYQAARRPAAAAEDAAPADDEKASEASPAVEGVAGALLGLLALVREDYDLAPVEVSAGETELSTLVAGRLMHRETKTDRPKNVTVEVDGFRGSVKGPTSEAFGSLVVNQHKLTDTLASLANVVTPVEARRDALRARMDALETVWAEAVVTKDAPAGAADEILERMTSVAKEQRQLDARLAPVGSFVKGRARLLQEIRDRMTELTAAPASGGLSPLGKTIRSERISPKEGEPIAVTHVLYVHVDALGGDKVTRKTWLGEPGRVGFLGSFNGSWLLAQTDGTIISGNSADGAARITFDIGTGQASLQAIADSGAIEPTPRDWLAAWTPALVVALLAVVGVAALLFALAPILEVLRGGA